MTDPEPGPDALGRLPQMRVRYGAGELREDELASTPLRQFADWLQDAREAGLAEPNAMVLATASVAGVRGGGAVPSTRDVLLKHVDGAGFVFYTNLGSRKARELAENPWASLLFPWFAMQRQVVVVGDVVRVATEEAAAYFRTRPYGARIGAWASRQSEVLASREDLQARYDLLRARYPDTGSADDVPLPDFWGGYVVRPRTVEFWHGRPSRLHDRLRYRCRTEAPARLDDPGAWVVERLNP